MVGGGVRPGVARPQDPGQRFAGGIQEREQRVMPEPALVGRRRALLVGVGGDQRAVEIDHVEPGIGARRPHPSPCLGTSGGDPLERGGVDRVQRAPRRRVRRHLTEQGRAGCAAPPDRRSLRRHRRSITATSTSTRPRSWPRRRCFVGAIAADRPAVRPRASARSDNSRTPAWLTTLSPSALTFSRGRQRLRFTSEVPSWFGTTTASTTAVSPTRRAFSRTRHTPTPPSYCKMRVRRRTPASAGTARVSIRRRCGGRRCSSRRPPAHPRRGRPRRCTPTPPA